MNLRYHNAVDAIRGHLNAPSEAEHPDNFYVEPFLLSYYMHADCLRTRYLGEAVVNLDLAGEHECEGIAISGDDSIDGPTGECICLYYFDGDGCHSGPNHALVAIYDENVVYWREAWHNPRTEWCINELADDIKDEDGDFIFPGEPVQI